MNLTMLAQTCLAPGIPIYLFLNTLGAATSVGRGAYCSHG